MAEELTPDICVIGGGPGGIALAAAAARASVPVVLVEKGRMGGASLSRGSAPSKALVAAGARAALHRDAGAFGVLAAPPGVDFGKVRNHVAEVVASLAAQVSPGRLTALGVQVVAGSAAFTDPRTVAVGDTIVRARRFVLAPGAPPRPPALPGLGDIPYLTVEAGYDLAERPASLAIYGDDPRSLELAQAWRRLGVDTVVLCESLPLADEDPELSAIVLDGLRAEGVAVRSNARITNLAAGKVGARVSFATPSGDGTVDATHLVVAAGRAVDIDGLGLYAGKIDHEDGLVLVDRRGRTSNRRVFAIGDAVAGPASVNRAEYEAAEVLRSILYRWSRPVDPAAVPVVVFTDPALAHAGMSEVEATRRYNDVRVLRWPFVENDLAAAERATTGVIKVLARADGRILGAAIVGRDAGEMIGLWSLAIARGMGIRDIATMIPPYPSRMDVSRRVAETFDGPGQAPRRQRRIIEFLRKFG